MVISIVWIAVIPEQRANLNRIKKVYENKDVYNIITPSEDIKILKFNQYQKSDKAPIVIYADLECLTKKIDECKNNPEYLSTTKVNKHFASGFSMPTSSPFRSIKNKHNVYRGKGCMEKWILKRARNEDK